MSENKIKDGGPAFPGPGEQFVTGVHGIQPQSAYGMQGSEGMSLRDYFAAKAMEARIITLGHHKHRTKEEVQACKDQTAELAYQMADAMLRAREHSNPK